MPYPGCCPEWADCADAYAVDGRGGPKLYQVELYNMCNLDGPSSFGNNREDVRNCSNCSSLNGFYFCESVPSGPTYDDCKWEYIPATSICGLEKIWLSVVLQASSTQGIEGCIIDIDIELRGDTWLHTEHFALDCESTDGKFYDHEGNLIPDADNCYDTLNGIWEPCPCDLSKSTCTFWFPEIIGDHVKISPVTPDYSTCV